MTQHETSRLTLFDVVANHARSRPDHLAIGDGDVRLSWRDFATRIERTAVALHDAGVREGERVLWLGQNSFRVQELLLACARLGALFCPANWRQQPEELAFVIDDLEPVVVVTQQEEVGDTVDAGLAAAHHSPARTVVHDAEGADSYESFVSVAGSNTLQREPATSSEDPLLLIYTAAFSGRPNAAMLPHRALIAQSLLLGPWMGITAEHRYLNAGPMFHIGVFMENLATMQFGGTNVFVRRSDGHELCKAIESFRCTGSYIVGPMHEAMRDANADGRYDLSSLAPRDTPWHRRAGGYGQTEVMGMATFNLLSSPDEIGTHGRPSPVIQLRVVDPDDRDVGVGETGEIAIRGATVMLGYWNRDEVNAERSRNGWHHTNDLGRYEADGTFSFVGPKGRMLKSGAENIYPAEVEGALKSHPAVADAAIIGVPDARWVQSVKAIVVLRDGMTATPDELIAHCKAKIASYKKPRTVELVDALPRNGFMVDYDALDARFGGGNYPGGTTRSV